MSYVKRSEMNPNAIFIEKKKWAKYIKGFETLLNEIEAKTKYRRGKSIKYILSKDDMESLNNYILDKYYREITQHIKSLSETTNGIEYKFVEDLDDYICIISFELGAIEELTEVKSITNTAKKNITYELRDHNFHKLHYIIKIIRNVPIKIILTD